MTTLQIDLQTGFQDDPVEVTVDDEIVFQEDAVATSALIGVAEDVAVDVSEGTHRVEVRLPARDITASTEITVEGETYLGVSLEDNEVVFRVSEEEFGYM